jgi:hypothetical protein
MGLPWIKLYADLPRHPKARLLGRELGEKRAWSYLVQLWAWCSEFAPDGVVRGRHAGALVEEAAGWEGETGRFVAAAISAGFIEGDAELYRVHDWDEHNEAHLKKLERDRDRQQNRRATIARQSREHPETVATCPSDDLGERRGEESKNRKRSLAVRAAEDYQSAESSGQLGLLGDQPEPEAAPAPKKQKQPSRQEALWLRLQEMRTQALPDSPNDPGPAQPRLNAFISDAVAQLSEAGVEIAWRAYLADPWAQKLDPPCPLRCFTREKRAECHSRATRVGLAPSSPAEPAAPPKCVCCQAEPATHTAGVARTPICESCVKRWQSDGNPPFTAWLEEHRKKEGAA